MDSSEIKKFYSNKSIFITGATGFLGKILLLKLLVSCPDIDTIYVLLRPKKEVSSAERLASLLESPPFTFISDEVNIDKKKIVGLDGDITKPELGLSSTERQLIIDNVSVVFHCAACVKFNAPLKEIIDLNLLGTKQVIDICHQIKKLSCFIHCSTAYSHCQRREIDEVFYEMSIDPKDLLRFSEWLPPESLDLLAPHLMNGIPNTYTYTKALAENLVQEECKTFPTAVVRPSIVISSEMEPIPGWVDNLNGPSGVRVLATLGILRCANWNYYAIVDYVPVDKVVNALIAIGYATGTEKSSNHPTVYNVTSSNVNPITLGKVLKYGYEAAKEVPSTRLIRPIVRPPKQMALNPIFYQIKTFFTHWMFAYFLDLIIWISGNKRMMVKVTGKMHFALEVINYFSQNEWTFKSDNLIALWSRLNSTDQKDFNFDMVSIDWQLMAKKCCLGDRRFLLKETDDTIPSARKRMQRIIIGYWTFKLVLILFSLYLVISWTPILAVLGYFGRNLCSLSSTICK